jgi:flagellar biogenesis protein FliO
MLTEATAAITALEADITTVTGLLVGAAALVLAGRWIVARFF